MQSSPGPAVADGIGVALPVTMMTNTMTNTPGRSLKTEPACILRWVFHRGPDALTCAVEAAGGRSSYDVCILPQGLVCCDG